MPRKKSTKEKRPSLNELAFADGKGKASLEQLKELDELIGIKQVNPFGTLNEEVLEDNLSTMNLSDMQSLAVKAGVHPSGNRTTLKNKLIREFKAKVAGKGIGTFVSKPLVNPNSPKGKKLAKLMSF